MCGVSIRLLIDMESIGGNEYTSAVIYGDIAGVGGVELVSTADSSDRPKDGVLAMGGHDPEIFKVKISYIQLFVIARLVFRRIRRAKGQRLIRRDTQGKMRARVDALIIEPSHHHRHRGTTAALANGNTVPVKSRDESLKMVGCIVEAFFAFGSESEFGQRHRAATTRPLLAPLECTLLLPDNLVLQQCDDKQSEKAPQQHQRARECLMASS